MDERLNDEIFTQAELEAANEKLKGSENITLPDGLSPQSISRKLEKIDVWKPEDNSTPKQKKGKKKIYSLLAFAATFVIVVASVMLIKPWEKQNEPPVINEGKPAAQAEQVQDYSRIEEMFSSYAEKYESYNLRYGAFNGIFKEEAAIMDSANVVGSASQNSSSAPKDAAGGKNYGTTNEQVQGVSEADIIKNDGSYIYVVNPENADWESYYDAVYAEQGVVKTTVVNGEPVDDSAEHKADNEGRPVLEYDCSISIIEPSADGKLKKAGTVKILQGDNKDIYYMTIREMYVSGNKLIAIVECSVSEDEEKGAALFSGYKSYSYAYGGGSSITMAVCFDISNKSAPQELWRVYQDGSYISSRLINDQLVLLSDYWVDIAADEEVVANTCVPEYAEGNGAMKRIPCDCIVIGNRINNPTYLVASTLDIYDKSTLKTQAVLGAGSNVYCTTETLYVTSTKYKSFNVGVEVFGESDEATEIHKFSIKDYDIKYLGCAHVKGYTLNQFSIDEYNGYLRIATTTGTWGDSLSNQLYVLDEALNVVGKIEDIAKGETIKSVRFAGDTGYVVTFEQTDPLFVVDLSEPTKPTIKGELKIPGFSTYLHPVSETLLLGVGVDGTNDGQGNGMKISLFDVSNPEKPKEVDKIEFNGIDAQNRWAYVNSPAFYEHKAICWNAKEGVMYIPYSRHDRIWASSSGETLSESYVTGVMAVKVDEATKTLQTEGTYIVNEFENELSRVTYIGDVLLGYSYPEALVAFDKQTQTITDKIEL